MGAARDLEQLPPIIPGARWAVDFEHYGADESTPEDYAGWTASLTLAPLKQAQPSADDVHALAMEQPSDHVFGARLADDDHDAWTPGPYVAVLRLVDPAEGAEVSYIGVTHVWRGPWDVAASGGGNAPLPGAAPARVQIFRDSDAVRIVRGAGGATGKSAKQVVIDAGYLPAGTTDAEFATWLESNRDAAQASAAAAATSADAAEASAAAAAADRLQTGQDRIATSLDAAATAADRVQTGLDRTATGEDAAATAADRVQTGLDRVATGQDAVATAADRVQTGLDRIATAGDAQATDADRAQTGLDRIATAADAVATAADRVASAGSATTATTQAGIATTKAGEAQAAAAAAATSAASVASQDVATAYGIEERVAGYDPAATSALRLATVRRGVENRPAASSGAAYFRRGLVASTALTGVATFTRATPATSRDLNGTAVASFASGAPRVNTAGYRAEEGRTNLFINCNSWSAAGAGTSLVSTTITAPDGTATASRITGLLAGAGDRVALNGSAVVAGLTTYSGAFWIKGTAGEKITALSKRTTGTSAGSASRQITFTGAWQRVEDLTFTAAADNPGANVYLQNNGTTDTANTVDLWAGQLEAGAFSTSTILTAGATATRNADVCQETVDVPVGQAFTVTGKFIAPPAAASSPVAFELLPAANANDRLMLLIVGGTARLAVSSAGLAGADPFGGFSTAVTPGAPVGFAISVSGSAVTWSINGAAAVSATLPGGAFSQALTRLALGCRVIGTQQLNSTLRELLLHQRAFSAAELAAASDVSLEWDLDFTTQTYRYLGAAYASPTELPGTVFSRATTATVVTLAGYLLTVASGGLRVSDAGLTVEPARTNKCTNANVGPASTTGLSLGGDPAALLSVVDDSAALAALGISGNAYKLDNTAGTGTAQAYFPGVTGNTNAHSCSAYVRTVGGSARVGLGSSGATSYAASAAYTRRTNENRTPVNASQQAFVEVQAGVTAYFILNQLEEGAYSSTVIRNAGGATATRNADVFTTTEAAPAAYTVAAEFTVPAAGGGTPTVWSWDDATVNNRAVLRVDWATMQLALIVITGGVVQANIALGAVVAGMTYKVAAAFAANDVAVSIGGAAVQTDTTVTLPAVTTFRYGAGAGGAEWGPGVRRIRRWRGRKPNADLQALAA